MPETLSQMLAVPLPIYGAQNLRVLKRCQTSRASLWLPDYCVTMDDCSFAEFSPMQTEKAELNTGKLFLPGCCPRCLVRGRCAVCGAEVPIAGLLSSVLFSTIAGCSQHSRSCWTGSFCQFIFLLT